MCFPQNENFFSFALDFSSPPRPFPILAMLRRLYMRAPASALLEHAPSAFPRAWPYSRIEHRASDVSVSFALITETGAPPTDSRNCRPSVPLLAQHA